MATPITQATINTGGGTIALAPSTSYILMEPVIMTAPFSSVGASVIFDGGNYTITMNYGINFVGLFSATVTVSNLGVLPGTSTLDAYAGWFFALGIGGSATNCYSIGDIGDNGGGIFGASSSGDASNCYSTGTIGTNGGGIFGNSSSGGTATNCYSTGPIGVFGGGIFGRSSPGTAIAENCYSTGDIDQFGGGIFGQFSSGNAKNCYSTGDIGNNGGGIFGYQSSGTATNCYTTGILGIDAGPFFGYDSTGTSPMSGHSTGWIDASANDFLVGDPADPIPPRVWMRNTNYNILGPDNRPYIFYMYIPCFVAGTHIMTANGYKAVEDLTLEDRIVTADGRPLPFNLYTTVVNCTTVETAPYRIPKGAFGRNSPPQDITLSPQHAIQSSNSTWQIPKYAVKQFAGITQVCVGEKVHYYHIEMPNFFTDNIIANESIVESYAAKQVKWGVKIYKFNSAINGFTRINTGGCIKHIIKL